MYTEEPFPALANGLALAVGTWPPPANTVENASTKMTTTMENLNPIFISSSYEQVWFIGGRNIGVFLAID